MSGRSGQVPGGRQARRARAPLFDRLAGFASVASRATALEGPTPRRFGEAELRRSILRELSDLLNTRCQLPMAVLEARRRTTIDYGMPDPLGVSIGDETATARLLARLSEAIAVYEPRLRDPVITRQPLSGARDRLAVTISGRIDASAPQTVMLTYDLLCGTSEDGSHGG